MSFDKETEEELFEIFREEAKSKGYEDESVKNTTPCIILAELVRVAENIQNKKRNISQ